MLHRNNHEVQITSFSWQPEVPQTEILFLARFSVHLAFDSALSAVLPFQQKRNTDDSGRDLRRNTSSGCV